MIARRELLATSVLATMFPDFIETGLDVWMAAYDWHVKHGQPINVGRDLAGRWC